MRRVSGLANHLKPETRVVGVHGVGLDAASLDGIVAGMETFDLPGHGSSGVRLDRYQQSDGFNALASVVSGRRTPVLLVGHSLGAYLALRYAILNPSNVCGICCIAGGPGLFRFCVFFFFSCIRQVSRTSMSWNNGTRDIRQSRNTFWPIMMTLWSWIGWKVFETCVDV